MLPAYQMQYPSKKLISNQPTQEFGLDYSAPQAGAGGEVNRMMKNYLFVFMSFQNQAQD